MFDDNFYLFIVLMWLVKLCISNSIRIRHWNWM